MKKWFKYFRKREKGFTLIELLVVVAILGVLAAVAIPQIGKFIGTGQDQAYDVELHNVQTAVMALMLDADSNKVDVPTVTGNATADLSTVTSAVSGVDASVADYMSGLEAGVVKTGCTYDITGFGVVTQHTP